MASTSTFTFNTPQRLDFLSFSFCKSSFISPFSFSSSKHTLHLNFPSFIFVKPHITLLTPVHNSIFCSLNHNFSNRTVNFRDITENSSFKLKEEKFLEGKDGRGFSKNTKRSRNFGGRFNFGKRNENGDKDHSFKRDSKRVERKMEEKVGKISNVNGDFRKNLKFSEVRAQNEHGFSSRRSEEVSSMSVGVNQIVDREVTKGKGDVWKRVERKMEENVGKVEKISNVNGDIRKKLKISEFRGQNGDGFSSRRGQEANSTSIHIVSKGMIKNDGNCNKVKKKEKGSKKSKPDSPEFQLRVGLDMCSKKGDVMGAISLYDSAIKQGVKLGQYHYTVLLYLCSSASMGVIRPAKSGSGSRSLDKITPQNLDDSDEEEEDDEHDDADDGDDDGSDGMNDEVKDMKKEAQKLEVNEIRVSDDVKKCALEKGFEIYEKMSLDKVQMNEASLTSIARMAMAMGNGDMAFDMVNRMKSMGITPKLRSYGPALSVFTSKGDVEKAFLVEKHMLENGVHPEEPELEALLRVSVETGKADRVYYVLHELRTSVRSVSPSIADLIEKWFNSKEASRVGKRKWDHDMIAQIMESVGGGWHGKGWFGKGKWSVSRTRIGVDGLCKCCGEKLALIDLDPEETERFAESVGSIAIKKEKNANFQKFQRWLDYYGPFEAVVDAANVGLYSQRKFKASKVHAVVNGIRQMHPSRKWPLIVLHNRRVTGGKLDKPIDKDLVERWKNADALYATPTGSNDDWYWLYAAIKFKCLLITNDEMRDHTFQLLGNDFFPKWKERHQVRFSFSEVGPVFHFPPPCSVVIQESGNGHWHIPIASEHQSEEERIWLCVTRPKSLVDNKSHKIGEDLGETNRA